MSIEKKREVHQRHQPGMNSIDISYACFLQQKTICVDIYDSLEVDLVVPSTSAR